MSSVLETAVAYSEAGLSIFPVPSGTKKPIVSWKRFQFDRMDRETVLSTFNDETNLAIVGGISSKNLIVFDEDKPNLFKAIKKDPYFKELVANTWECISPSGRNHFYFRTPFPIQTRNFNNTLGFELRGQGAYVIAPPSIFQKDQMFLPYKWARRNGDILTLSASDLSELSNRFEIAFDEFEGAPTTKPFGMPWKFYSMILGNYEKYGFFPKGEDRKRTTTEADFQIVLNMVSSGWHYHRIKEFIQTHSSEKSNFKQRPYEYTELTIKKALQWYEQNKSEIARTVERLRSIQIETKNSVVDSLAYEYFLNVAQRTNKLSVGLSIRELAENIGIGKDGAHSSIKRLVQSGVIQVERLSGAMASTVYEIKSSVTNRQSIIKKNVIDCLNMTLAESDAFRTKRGSHSLGKPGMIIYALLSTESKPSKDLVCELAGKVSRKTVFRKLAIMQKVGLIERSKGGVRLLRHFTNQEIADRLGTTGQARKQKRHHDADRQFERELLKSGLDSESKEIARRYRFYQINRHYQPTDGGFVNPTTGEFIGIYNPLKRI